MSAHTERLLEQYSSLVTALTKRELFAAMAMQGICACPLRPDLTYDEQARYAVEAADSLLEALKTQEKSL